MKTNGDIFSKARNPKRKFGIRHLQTVMLFLALVLAYSMRVNMSIAIVAMTDNTDGNAFDWSMQMRSLVLSSFFWGYVILQIPAGELAAKFGGAVLITISIGVNSGISLLIPLAAYYGGWKAVCVCRVMQGLSQGFIYPSTHNLIGKWMPLDEKSGLGSMIYAGAQLGTAIQLISSGFIAQYWGWPAIFYVNGGLLDIVWFGYGIPKKLKTPWGSILTSPSFLCLIVVHSCHAWGFWTLMTEMPSYFKHVLGFDIKSNGMMSALPYFAMYFLSFPFGFISDWVLKKQYLTITASRKLNTSIGLLGPAVALTGLSYSPADNATMAVIILTVVVALDTANLAGFMLVHIDMAPNFAGTMMGITNCMAILTAIAAPLVAGSLLKNETDVNEWRKVFYLSSAIYIAGNVTFIISAPARDSHGNERKIKSTT